MYSGTCRCYLFVSWMCLCKYLVRSVRAVLVGDIAMEYEGRQKSDHKQCGFSSLFGRQIQRSCSKRLFTVPVQEYEGLAGLLRTLYSELGQWGNLQVLALAVYSISRHRVSGWPSSAMNNRCSTPKLPPRKQRTQERTRPTPQNYPQTSPLKRKPYCGWRYIHKPLIATAQGAY